MSSGFQSHSALYLKIWFIRLYRFYSETTDRGTWLQHQGLGYALIGSTKELLDGIVAEQEALTMDIAQGLEMVLGVSAAMWMNLQKAYDQAMSV